MQETLEDQLRRATRHFTARLPEEEVFRLGGGLARELARAHAESPPRYPELDPASIPIVDGKPRLDGGAASGDAREALFRLGALLHTLATGAPAEVSWWLDGPPPAELSTVFRRGVLAALGAPGRDRRFASAAEAAAALETALAPEATERAAWPLFRCDPERRGSRVSGPIPSGLAASWEVAVGNVVASPLITPRLVVALTAEGRLLFLDKTTGRLLFDFHVGSAVESSPALAESVLHVGTDDGELVGIDMRSGRESYRVKLGQLVRSSPLPLGERVLVGVVESKDGGALMALHAASGKLLWKRKLGAVFSSPARAGALVLVGSDDGSLHAVEPDKGTVVWSHRLGGRVRSTPAVAGELAIVGDFEGRLAAVRLQDGSRAWTRELGAPIYSSPCLAGSLAVVGSNDGQVHGVDTATGALVFSVRTKGPVVSSAAALDDRVLVGSTDGELHLLDSRGALLSSLQAADGLQSSPAVDDDFVAVGSGRGVHALRLLP
jgi:outer membrane protein assembly factor BamB